MSSGENHFDRLPDDAVLHIFNKLSDAQWLCISSTVSKRFSLLIPHLHTLSVSFLPRLPPPPSHFPEKPTNFPKKIFNFFVAKPLLYLYHHLVKAAAPNPPPSLKAGLFQILSHFEEIQSLRLELPPFWDAAVDHTTTDSLLFKWGAKFGTQLETVAFLSLTSLHHPMTAENENPLVPSEQARVIHELRRGLKLATGCAKDALMTHALLVGLIKNYPMLKSIAVVYPNKWESSLCASGEGLSRLRELVNSTPCEDDLLCGVEDLDYLKLRWCHLPVLRLPFSGHVMEDVTFVMFDLVDLGGDDAVVIESFSREEEGAFGEAVAEILTTHKEKVEGLADFGL